MMDMCAVFLTSVVDTPHTTVRRYMSQNNFLPVNLSTGRKWRSYTTPFFEREYFKGLLKHGQQLVVHDRKYRFIKNTRSLTANISKVYQNHRVLWPRTFRRFIKSVHLWNFIQAPFMISSIQRHHAARVRTSVYEWIDTIFWTAAQRWECGRKYGTIFHRN